MESKSKPQEFEDADDLLQMQNAFEDLCQDIETQHITAIDGISLDEARAKKRAEQEKKKAEKLQKQVLAKTRLQEISKKQLEESKKEEEDQNPKKKEQKPAKDIDVEISKLGWARIGQSQVTLWHRPGVGDIKELKRQAGITMIVTLLSNKEQPMSIMKECQQ